MQKPTNKAPRSVTNELEVVNEVPAADSTPAQVTNEATPAPAAPAVSTPAPKTVDNAAPAITTPPVVSTPARQYADNALTTAFNAAFNDGQPRRTALNICDANRILPGDSPVLAVSLWSLVTKTPVSQSVNIVRQLGKVAVTKQSACAANSQTLDVSVDYTALLGNYFATVPVCNRTLRRNEMNDAYIRANMEDSAELGLDADILSGAFANSSGLKGIIGDTGTIALTAGSTLGAALGKLQPKDLANATIVLRASDWFTMLETAEQLKGCCVVYVNGIPEMRYLGARVVPSLVIPDTIYAVVGNFARYIAGYNNVATVTADTSVKFDEDKTVFKIQVEACGGPNATKKTVNALEVSSFVTIAAAAAG